MKLVLIALTIIGSVHAHARVSKAAAVDFLKSQLPNRAEDTIRDRLEIVEVGNGLTQIGLNYDGEHPDAFLVRERSNGLEDTFQTLAQSLRGKRIVARFVTTSLASLPIVIAAPDEDSYVIDISDSSILSTILRNVTGYSRSLIPGFILKEGAPDLGDEWAAAMVMQNGVWIPSQVKVKFSGFMMRSPEVFDGSLVAILKDPSLISRAPNVNNGEVKYMPWSQLLDSVWVESEGKWTLLCSRVENTLNVPIGPVSKELGFDYTKSPDKL